MAIISSSKIDTTLGLLSRTHRKRYREVISVLAKYGLDEFLAAQQIQRIPLLNRLRKKDPELLDLSRPVRVRMAVEELGGAYIKVGQILSNRPDLLPEELLDELEKLQDNVPPFSSKKAVEIIEKELGQPLDETFLMFDETSLASASIAQVHRAVLLDGTPVVLKIRRPGLKEKFKVDLDILIYLSQYLARSPKLKKQFEQKNPIKELRHEIEKELDFLNEASHMEQFAKNFFGDERVYVPGVFPSYTTSKVLTMEFVMGIKINDVDNFNKFGIDPETVAYNLVDVGLTQIFDHRFFHGDPHPGNILVLENQKLCFLDFGLMGRITTKQHQTIIDLITAFAGRDEKKITRIIMKSVPRDSFVDEDKLESEVSELLDRYFESDLQDVNVGEALESILDLIYTYDLTLNPNTYLLIKAVASYEGIGRKIYPGFELATYAQHFSRKLMKQQLSPKRILKEVYSSTADTVALARDFPGEVRNLLHLLQSGRLRVNAGVVDLRETVDYSFDRVDKIINRLSFSVIVAAMIMGSAMILRQQGTAEFQGIPVFATIGFVVSFILALILAVSIIRNRGL